MVRHVYALLVGIDQYAGSVRPLEGCVNDINAIATYLEERLDHNQYQLHVEKLLNEQATRKAVIAKFQQHLGQATHEDVALFYYSGHGSQEPAPREFWHLELDRMDETLVCWDSRTSDWDLADKELAYLIAQAAKNDPHFVIVLDCCHSGSGTRDAGQKVRHTPADRRARTVQDFIFSLQELESIALAEGGASGWNLPQGRRIVLAGCQDQELASEYSGDNQPRGAFSYFLLDTLQKANGTLTYRELFKRSSALVRSRIKTQTPQIEVSQAEDLDLPFFNDAAAIAPRQPYFTLSYERDCWAIDAGAVHGIPHSIDDPVRLALYPQGSPSEQMRQIDQAIAQAEVIEVLPHQSIVKFTQGGERFTCDTVLNAMIVSLPLPVFGVYFEGDAGAIDLVQQEMQIASGGKPSLYVRRVETRQEAQYRLLARGDELLITKPTDDRPLVEQLVGYSHNARKVVQNLEHIARWTSIVELQNLATGSLPPDVIKLRFYQDASGSLELKEAPLRLEYELEQGKWKKPAFYLQLENVSDRRLYCTLLDLTEEYSISAPLFPNTNGGIWLEAGQAVWAFDRRPIALSIPDRLLAQGVTEYQDILKLIASTAEFDPTLLIQPKLGNPRPTTRSLTSSRSTLNRLMAQATMRDFAVIEAEEIDEWLTSQIAIVTVRPKDTQPLQATQPTNLGTGVVVLPHSSLQADARLTTILQATRDVGSHVLPPILRDDTQPFQFTTSRGVDPGLSALELQIKESDAASIATVTPAQPLRLIVDKPLAADEYILPVAYDGEFFLPLGRGQAQNGKTEIRLDRLPSSISDKKKSLGGSIRIFFQKVVSEKLGLEFPYPILAAVTVNDDGSIAYEADPVTVKQRIAAANNIAIFIHGIIGDTQSIVPCVRQIVPDGKGGSIALTQIYDLFLTFDYENLNTAIGTIAEQLRDRLAKVGLSANHSKTLHIIAHSMGGLVSRSFIEQKGGDRVVQHLIMLGTPNAGSPWATVQDWAIAALGIGINSLSTVALPIKVLGSLVAASEAIDINLDQMKPGSEFLTTLKDAADPGVPYTIVAGNTSIIQPPDRTTENRIQALLAKLVKGAIEFPFLGAPNDIAVTVHSIKNVPHDRSPQPQVVDVACNHLVYFTDPAGLRILAEVVANSELAAIPRPTPPPVTSSIKLPAALSSPATRLSWLPLVLVTVLSAIAGIWLWQEFNPAIDRNNQPNQSGEYRPQKLSMIKFKFLKF
ncbi:MAG: caspase family protein [Trichocoleus desertorum ATA4-8-CV12]|nr:caspase family protein [Trichocoleus desertorum ATA4-8-CV12]